jgi:hypothetical protein
MRRTCYSCRVSYDDITHSTAHPHQRFISDEAAAQKDLAFSLIGKKLVFTDRPKMEPFAIESIGAHGMVTIRGLTGEFAPSLFVEVKDDEQLT